MDFIARRGAQFEFVRCSLFARNLRMRSASKLFASGWDVCAFGVATIRLQASGGVSVEGTGRLIVVSGGSVEASAPGLALVVVDFGTETLQVKAKGLVLASPGAGTPFAVRIGAGFGGGLRSVDLTLSREGTKLTW